MFALSGGAQHGLRPRCLGARRAGSQWSRQLHSFAPSSPGIRRKPHGKRAYPIQAVKIEASPALDPLRSLDPADGVKEKKIIADLKTLYDPSCTGYSFVLRTDESEGDAVLVEGAVPEDFPPGAYLRNGPNSRFPDKKSDHFFDGDGMIHGTVFAPDGRKTYFNRWVRSLGFQREDKANGRIYGGVLSSNGFQVLWSIIQNFVRTGTQFKDTANTSLVYHAGHLLALMEAGLPSKLAVGPGGMETVDPAFDYGGKLTHPFTAHPKVDPTTGEMFTFGYDMKEEPHVSYSIVSPEGEVTYSTGLNTGRPSMMHDYCITQQYAVLLDLPLIFKNENLIAGKFPVGYYPEDGARMGLVKKGTDEIQWFDIAPANVFHTANAYEDPATGEVVVTGGRSNTFRPPFYEFFNPGFMHEWRLDPQTGAVTERRLNDRVMEFPKINEAFFGRPARYAYTLEAAQCLPNVHGYTSPSEALVFGPVCKHDLVTGEIVDEYSDGYLCGYLADGRSKESFLGIWDAQDLKGGLVAKLKLPADVPYGLHGTWVPWEALTPSI